MSECSRNVSVEPPRFMIGTAVGFALFVHAMSLRCCTFTVVGSVAVCQNTGSVVPDVGEPPRLHSRVLASSRWQRASTSGEFTLLVSGCVWNTRNVRLSASSGGLMGHCCDELPLPMVHVPVRTAGMMVTPWLAPARPLEV